MNNKIDYCINDFIKEIKLPQYEGVINKSIVDWAVKLAYKDAQRTMIGIYKYEKEKNAALNEITENITMYFKKTEPFASPEEFDEMHESLCDIWTKAFDSTIIGTYGRAQKIVNMTFKYLYCIDYHKKKYYEWFKFCHIALDSYILDWMHQNIQVCSQIKFNKNIKWSNLEKNMYKELAGKAIRGVLNTPMFENSTALEAEFLIWDASIIYRTSYEYVKMLNKYKGRDYMNVEMALTAESIDNYIEKIKS